ncbi:MAG TPA: glycosyltransferase family A protein [Acidimicrobiales bacterium]|nr:glycosyltransferase family A protein [Acidimicrobiales bacterium]
MNDALVKQRGDAPRVSVIMIFLNAERFLPDAVASVHAQTYDDWELLLIDDGSTDGTTAQAYSFVAADPGRIRYFDHQGHANRGMSESRNVGLRHARGELVGFLDADDVYFPSKLAHQVGELDAHPEAGLVYGATAYWYSWTGRAEDQPRDRERRRGVEPGTLIAPPQLLRLFVLGKARTPTTCGALMRRAAVERVGGFNEQFTGMFEDQVFFYKLCAETTVYIGHGCFDRYRQHPASWSYQALARGDWTREPSPTPARRAFNAWVAEFLRSRGLFDPELRRALRRDARLLRHPWLARALALLGRGRRATQRLDP